MDKKYQVFISSTYKDLVDERKEIIQVLLELNCIPCGMELFQASNSDQWSLIKKVIDSCDYYIVIVAGKCGTIHPETGQSFTRMEYEYALERGIPILGFIHEDIDCLPKNKTEVDPEKIKKLSEFSERVMENRHIRRWKDASHLGSLVSRGIIQLIKDYPRDGWIKVTTDIYQDVMGPEHNELQKAYEKINQYKVQNEKYIQDIEQKSDQLKVAETKLSQLELMNSECFGEIEAKSEDICCKGWMSNPLLLQDGGCPIRSRMKRHSRRGTITKRYCTERSRGGLRLVLPERGPRNGVPFPAKPGAPSVKQGVCGTKHAPVVKRDGGAFCEVILARAPATMEERNVPPPLRPETGPRHDSLQTL